MVCLFSVVFKWVKYEQLQNRNKKRKNLQDPPVNDFFFVFTVYSLQLGKNYELLH